MATTKGWSSALLAALAATAALLLFLHPGEEAAPTTQITSSEVAARGSDALSAQPAPDLASPERTKAPPPELAPVLVHGRCVDETGAPLAGITATLARHVFDRARDERWRIAHVGEPEWIAPEPVTTASDGAYRLSTSALPSAYALELRLGDASHPDQLRRWRDVRAGADLDAGTVVLHLGGELAGRVVDPNGRGVAGCIVRVDGGERDRTAAEQGFVAAATEVVSGTDGAFAFPASLPAGEHRVGGSGALGWVGPVVASVVPGQRTSIDVPWRAWYQPDAILGRVIDEVGKPVPNAYLGAFFGRGLDPVGWSDEDGRFVVDPLPHSPPEGLRFVAWKHGYEWLDRDAVVPWATRDLVLVLTRGTSIAFTVVDEADRPVTDFTLRVFSTAGKVLGSGSLDRWLGPHEDGTVRIHVGEGTWTVLVECARRLALAPVVTEVHVQRGTAQTVRLRATRLRERWLRVVSASGTPMVGSKVQLCMPRNADGTWEDVRDLLSAFSQSGGAPAASVQSGTTDADGRLLLRGPGDRRLGLVVEGQMHLPLRVPDVTLAAEDELRVVVSCGGTLRGRLAPASRLEELRRLVDANAQPDAKPRPLAWMGFVGAENPRYVPADFDDATYAVGADGTFTVPRLPVGRWTVRLRYRCPPGLGNDRDEMILGEIEMPEEGDVAFEGDLRALAYGTLVGEVVRGATPHAGQQVVVELEPAPGVPWWEPQRVTTDAAGRFSIPVRIGALRVSQWGLQSGSMGWFAREVAVVEAGAVTQQRFVFAIGTLEATLVDAEGRPAANAALWLAPDDPKANWGLVRAGSDGIVRAEVAAQGYRLLLPSLDAGRHAQDVAASTKPVTRDALRSELRDVGSVLVVDGQTAAVTVRLPAAK